MNKFELPPSSVDFRGPTPTSNWVIKGRVMAGAYPGSREENEHNATMKQILDSNISTFVCLMEVEELKSFRPYLPTAQTMKPDIKYVAFPIPDNLVRENERVEEFVNELEKLVQEGEVLYVHCWGGHGRTGTIIACLLARLAGLNASEALRYTEAYHHCRVDYRRQRSPQNEMQRNQVRQIVDGVLPSSFDEDEN